MQKRKTNWLAVVGLLFIAVGLGSLYVMDNAKTQAVQNRVKEIDRLESAVYTEPKIGMLLTKFLELCGDSDEFRESESPKAKIALVTYKSTPERSKKGCAGRFTFVDYKLDTISR